MFFILMLFKVLQYIELNYFYYLPIEGAMYF